MQTPGEGAHMVALDVRKRHAVHRRREALQIARVGGDGVRRGALLHAQVVEVTRRRAWHLTA